MYCTKQGLDWKFFLSGNLPRFCDTVLSCVIRELCYGFMSIELVPCMPGRLVSGDCDSENGCDVDAICIVADGIVAAMKYIVLSRGAAINLTKVTISER